jgi:hypothetical protein
MVMSSLPRTTTHGALSSSPNSRRAWSGRISNARDEGLVGQVTGDEQVDVCGGAHEAETVDRETSDHPGGDTEAIQFPRERNQIRVGRDAG